MQTEINKTHYLWIFFYQNPEKRPKKISPPKKSFKKNKHQVSMNFG